jgi:hypothetical protein
MRIVSAIGPEPRLRGGAGRGQEASRPGVGSQIPKPAPVLPKLQCRVGPCNLSLETGSGQIVPLVRPCRAPLAAGSQGIAAALRGVLNGGSDWHVDRPLLAQTAPMHGYHG